MTDHRRRVLVLVENLSVPFDRRVWQESRALVEAGYEVHVICPQGATRDTEPYVELLGVHIHRYPLRAAGGGAAGYLREYGVAMWHTARIAQRLSKHGRFDVVHACNPPDLLLLAVLPQKWRGARFVFDHHDLVPELYLSRFSERPTLLYRATKLLERLTFALADTVISTNESYRRVAIERGKKSPDRVHVVRSAPDLDRFVPIEPDPSLRSGKAHLVVYLGVMGPQDGVDYALRAIAHLRAKGRDDFHTVFIGAGDAHAQCVALSEELGLADCVEFTGRVPDETVQQYLSTADVGLAPDPRNPLNDVSTMNKIVEYMAMSLPVVSFDLREARVSAGDAALYATPNDESEFAHCIATLLDDPDRRRQMGALGRARVEGELSWEHSRRALLAAYERIVLAGTRAPARTNRFGRVRRLAGISATRDDD